MEAIILTNEQREHLLEMTKKLFPEYPEIIFGRKYHPFTDYLWFCDKDGRLIIELHWFEFCILHLWKKVYKEHPYTNSAMERILDKGTIVDHLYDAFILFNK